jgi:Holliday junction resolvase RusA-like endonuclease
MKDYFNHEGYVQRLIKELSLNPLDISKIISKYSSYREKVYAIPLTIWASPTPYSPIRVNRLTGRFYVPHKSKLVQDIRKLIIAETGLEPFNDGTFPIMSETILKSSLYIKTPDAFSREAKFLAESKTLRPITTPDLDNVVKIINDAVKSFIIYDDAQIVSDITEKYYSRYPRMELVILYNGSPVHIIHKKIMNQRRERWKTLISGDIPSEARKLLQKYSKS